MKKQLLYANPDRYLSMALFFLRLSVGTFMLTHGIPKMMRFFGEEPPSFADPIGIGMMPSLMLVVFAEVFCSIFLALGLFTRWATLPLIIAMSVVTFVVHLGDGFGRMEISLLYLVIFIFLLATGPGRYSLDYLLFSRK